MGLFPSEQDFREDERKDREQRKALLEKLSVENQAIFLLYDKKKYEHSRQTFLAQTGSALILFYSAVASALATVIFLHYPSTHDDFPVILIEASIAVFFGMEAYKTGREVLSSRETAKALEKEIIPLKEMLPSESKQDLERLVY